MMNMEMSEKGVIGPERKKIKKGIDKPTTQSVSIAENNNMLCIQLSAALSGPFLNLFTAADFLSQSTKCLIRSANDEQLEIQQ